MARKQAPVTEAMSFEDLAKYLEEPTELQERSDDVVGYWKPEMSAIRGIPINAKVFDGNIEAHKPSCLITMKLLAPCAISLRKEEDEEDAQMAIAKVGDMVGVWAKPGLKAIRDCAGVDTWVKLVGEKKTGKPNPMKVYKIKSNGGTRIPIVEDTRDKSAGTKVFLEKGPSVKALASGDTSNTGDDDDDDGEEPPF